MFAHPVFSEAPLELFIYLSLIYFYVHVFVADLCQILIFIKFSYISINNDNNNKWKITPEKYKVFTTQSSENWWPLNAWRGIKHKWFTIAQWA